ncbi:MAG: HPr(Ser) kinase/phosphatase [Acidobacteriota bacterium]|nr:HPr(Ser) kinase/phosphatase [Acidobacteriota bacterium]
MNQAPGVTVGSVIPGLDLKVLGGAGGLDRRLTNAYIQKTGLALAGLPEYLRPGRVLVFGDSEIRFLDFQAPAARRQAITAIFAHDIPCVLITNAQTAPPELVDEADRAGVPLLWTAWSTPTAIARLTSALEDRLALRQMMHGVLMDLLGLGVLIAGESGIGKSECALDLVVRGHRLVADDTVEIRCRAQSVLIGSCPPLTRHHVEIRGLGLLNVTDLFGVASTRRSKRVELIVQLERWEAGREYDRLGLDDAFQEIMGVNVPLVRMPVAPGRNVAMLVEVAARNQLLRAQGRHAAKRLADRLHRRLERIDAGEDDDETLPGEEESAS